MPALPNPVDPLPSSATTPTMRLPRRPGRPAKADEAARLAALVEAAARVFLEHGYGGASIAAIAREARVTARTIYVKFGDKNGLFEAVIRHVRDRMTAEGPAFELDPRAPEPVLRDYARNFLWTMTRNEVVRIQRMLIAECERFPEMAAAYHQAGPARMLERLTAYFGRDDVRALLDARFTPASLTSQFHATLLNDAWRRQLLGLDAPPDRETVDARADAAVSLFLRGALARAG